MFRIQVCTTNFVLTNESTLCNCFSVLYKSTFMLTFFWKMYTHFFIILCSILCKDRLILSLSCCQFLHQMHVMFSLPSNLDLAHCDLLICKAVRTFQETAIACTTYIWTNFSLVWARENWVHLVRKRCSKLHHPLPSSWVRISLLTGLQTTPHCTSNRFPPTAWLPVS